MKTMLEGWPMETSSVFVALTRDPYTGSRRYQRYLPFLGLKLEYLWVEIDFQDVK